MIRRYLLLLLAFALSTIRATADVQISDPRYVDLGQDHAPVIAANGTTAFVAWRRETPDGDSEDVARAVSSDGVPLYRSRTMLAVGERKPAIGCNDEGCLVAGSYASGIWANSLDRGGARLGGNFDVSHPHRIGLVYPKPTAQAVAWDGARYVVVSAAEYAVTPPAGAIIASIVDPAGHILQDDLTIADVSGVAASAAKNGVTLIVWSAADQPTPGSVTLYARTLQGAGALGPVQKLAAGTATSQHAVAATPNGFAVVWNDDAVKVASFDSGGAFVSSRTLVHGPVSGAPALTGTSSGYAVAWSDGIDVFEMEVANGRTSTPRALSTPSVPALGAIGDSVIAAWVGSDTRVVVQRIDSTFAPAPLDVALWDQRNARAIFDGSNYIVVWNEDVTLAGRITPDGRHLDGPGVVIGSGSVFSLTRGDRVHLLVWQRSLVEFGATLVGSDLRTIPVTLPGGLKVVGAVWNGSSFLVFGTAVIAGEFTTGGVRIAESGELLDPSPIPVCNCGANAGVFAFDKYFFTSVGLGGVAFGSTVDDRFRPINISPVNQFQVWGWRWTILSSLATDGANYFVVSRLSSVWGTQMAARLVDHGGAPVSPEIPIAIGQTTTSVSVAWDGRAWVVGWLEPDRPSETSKVMISRISHDGSVVGSEELADTGSPATSVFVAPGAIVYGAVISTDEYRKATRLLFRPLPPSRQRVVAR